MKEYNASISPNPKDWLALDESQRLDLLFNFVEKHENHINEEAQRIHAVIHLNQWGQRINGVMVINVVVINGVRHD